MQILPIHKNYQVNNYRKNQNFQGTPKNPTKFSNGLSRRIVDLNANESILVGPREQNKELLSNLINNNYDFLKKFSLVDIMNAPDLDFSYCFYKDTDSKDIFMLTDKENLMVIIDDDGKVSKTDSQGHVQLDNDHSWHLSGTKDNFSFHPSIKDYFVDDLAILMKNMREKRYQKTTTKTEEVENKQITKANKENDPTALKGFARVGGQDAAINILKKEIIYPFKFPGLFPGVKPEVGYILYGPPGVGKSLLAEALSEEWDATFVSINANEQTSKYVGESEKNWRELFKKLENSAPSILFIDEGDALMRKRGGQDTHGDKMLNQFLQLVSKVKENGSKIKIIMATNAKLDTLDYAITRPGRFGRHIEMLPPQNLKDMETIFDIHTKKAKLAENIDKKGICEHLLEQKYTGAGVESLVALANIKALERLNLFEKMEQNTVELADYKNFCITSEDFYNASKEMNTVKSPKIGYQK